MLMTICLCVDLRSLLMLKGRVKGLVPFMTYLYAGLQSDRPHTNYIPF